LARERRRHPDFPVSGGRRPACSFQLHRQSLCSTHLQAQNR
jgi:hypothetical protein